MSDIYSTYVPPIGSRDADVMFVGEAPGKDEAKEREPFVGRSGQLATRYAERNNIPRPDASFWTNLLRYRPKGNKFSRALDSRQLKEGLAELKEEIQEVDPNVIVAFGGWPVHFLTGITGTRGRKPSITNWRGSVVPCTLVSGYKVLCSLHPAFVLRMWSMHPVFDLDLRRAYRESKSKEISRPEYEEFVDPEGVELEELTAEFCEADWISVDIETFPSNTMSCCGFGMRDKALVITFQKHGGWQYVKDILASPARKIFQFGTYDVNFMRRFYDFETASFYLEAESWTGERVEIQNVGWDTYVAAASLMPEHPRGLDFLTSIYTDFPYYKEERKQWKEDTDLEMLWSYNAKDVIATYRIAMKQMEEMEEKFPEWEGVS